MSFLKIGGGVEVDTKELQIQAVRENTIVVGKAKHPLSLAFREALEIKKKIRNSTKDSSPART